MFEIPGVTRSSRSSARGRWGSSSRPARRASTGSWPSRILLDALAQNKEFIKRFDPRRPRSPRSSRTTNVVNEPSTPARVNGHNYFVMEYVEGGTIKDHLDKNEVFEEKARAQHRARPWPRR